MSTALPSPVLAPRYVSGGAPALQLLSTAMPSASSSHAHAQQPAFLAAPIAAAVEKASDPVFDQTYLPYNWNSFLDADWLKLIVLFILAMRLTNTVFGMPLGVLPHPPRGPDDTPIDRIVDQYKESQTQGGRQTQGGGQGETGSTGAPGGGGGDETGPTGEE